VRVSSSIVRMIVVTCIDLIIINAVFLALVYWGPMDFLVKVPYTRYWIPLNLLYIFFSMVVFKTSRNLWRFFSIVEYAKLIVSVSTFSLVFLILLLITFPQTSTYSLVAFNVFLFCILIFALSIPRFVKRVLHFPYKRAHQCKGIRVSPCDKKRTLLIGAGQAGHKILREIQDYAQNQYHVVGFIDDDPSKKRSVISGVPVLGNSDALVSIIKKYDIQTIVFAIPSISNNRRREMILQLVATKVDIITVPGIYELLNKDLNLAALRTVSIEDLLPRKPIHTDLTKTGSIIQGKVVLLTGAGGSIGSELARQIARFKPKLLVLFENSENNLFYIDQELRNEEGFSNCVPVIADMRRTERVLEVFKKYTPDIVFHAAAYKHVPLMELNPTEAYANNVEGTRNLLDASVLTGVKTFINISTDKAVNPTCVMGRTKQEIEQLICHYDKSNGMVGASVRFGNVLGSEGSVLKVFQRQLEQEGMIRITDMNMKRYFMLIPEAVELVLQAASMAQGGDIFFLKMGDQVPIVDLAKAFTRLKGFELGKDIPIKVIGNRGNEKLAEELWGENEKPLPTDHEFIFRIAHTNQY
jgi:FlaA1/EpsC-like NDP-sugar epimerase